MISYVHLKYHIEKKKFQVSTVTYIFYYKLNFLSEKTLVATKTTKRKKNPKVHTILILQNPHKKLITKKVYTKYNTTTLYHTTFATWTAAFRVA